MRTSPRRGFTLIEILVVVSIIAILASLILGGVNMARKKAYIALSKATVANLSGQIERYVQDTGKYPGTEVKDGENAFPILFECLFGMKPSQGGKGGPSAPYGELKEEDVYVLDEESEDGDTYRRATSDEIYDPKVQKVIVDPWLRPYIYRENKSRPRRPHMHGRNFDLYSTGPDRIDQTIDRVAGEEEENDDIGSW